MSNNSFTSSLPFKLIVALVLGILVGLGLTSIEGTALCTALLNIIVTVRYISGQFINFCVPLIIIGFVAPSITRPLSDVCAIAATENSSTAIRE